MNKEKEKVISVFIGHELVLQVNGETLEKASNGGYWLRGTDGYILATLRGRLKHRSASPIQYIIGWRLLMTDIAKCSLMMLLVVTGWRILWLVTYGY